MPSSNDRVPALPNGFSSLAALGGICGLLLYVLPACADDGFIDETETVGDTDDTTGGFSDDTTAGDDLGTTGFSTSGSESSDGGLDSTTMGGDEEETDTETDGETDEETGGGLNVSCRPDNAMFSGEFLQQVGIEIDLQNLDCTVVSGFSALDMLQIDDFGDGTFGGSGSGLRVVDLSNGSFLNNKTFFEISDLPADEEIVLTLETDDGTQFSVRFTIDSATNSVTNVSVDF